MKEIYKRKGAYPIVISKENDGTYFVSIPDFNTFTQGMDIADSMEMARDAIGLIGIDLEDERKKYTGTQFGKIFKRKRRYCHVS